jgi:phage shock protein C
METMRRCPYCDEEIRAEAIRCRHCRSRLAAFDPSGWYRDRPERRVAGVAAALAHAFAVPVAAARFGFLIATAFHLFGVIAYAALWLLVPYRAGEEPPFARLVGLLRRIGAEIRDAVAPRARPTDASGAPRPPRPPDHDVPAAGVPC